MQYTENLKFIIPVQYSNPLLYTGLHNSIDYTRLIIYDHVFIGRHVVGSTERGLTSFGSLQVVHFQLSLPSTFSLQACCSSLYCLLLHLWSLLQSPFILFNQSYSTWLSFGYTQFNTVGIPASMDIITVPTLTVPPPTLSALPSILCCGLLLYMCLANVKFYFHYAICNLSKKRIRVHYSKHKMYITVQYNNFILCVGGSAEWMHLHTHIMICNRPGTFTLVFRIVTTVQ